MITQSKFRPYSPEATAEMLGMDRDSVISIANEYLSYVDEELSELEIAIKNGDYERIEFSSHKIKGVTANLGMEYVSKMAAHINSHAKKAVGIDYNSHYTTLTQLVDIASSQLKAYLEN